MQRVISVTELVRNVSQIAHELETEHTVYRIRRRGGRGMVLLDEDYYEGWLAAIELMQQPNWREDLARSRREAALGQGIPLDTVIKELGLEDPPQLGRRRTTRRVARKRGTKSRASSSSTRRRTAQR